MPGQITSASGTQYQMIINADGSIKEPLWSKLIAANASSQPEYIGECLPGYASGTNVSGTNFRIQKLLYGDGAASPPTGRLWASGSDGYTHFDKAWHLRATYTYD